MVRSENPPSWRAQTAIGANSQELRHPPAPKYLWEDATSGSGRII